MCVCVFSHVRFFAIPWTVACQVLCRWDFSRQEYCSGLLFPAPRISPPRDQTLISYVPCISRWILFSIFSKIYVFLIGGSLLYNIVLASAHIPMNQPQVYICPVPLEPPSHFPAHPTPLGGQRAPRLSSRGRTADSHWVTIFHVEMYVSMLLCQFAPPSPSPDYVHKSVLCDCIFTASLQIGLSVPSF